MGMIIIPMTMPCREGTLGGDTLIPTDAPRLTDDGRNGQGREEPVYDGWHSRKNLQHRLGEMLRKSSGRVL